MDNHQNQFEKNQKTNVKNKTTESFNKINKNESKRKSMKLEPPRIGSHKGVRLKEI